MNGCIFASTPQKPDVHLYIHQAKFYSLFFAFVSFNLFSCSANSYSHSRDFLEFYNHPKTDKLPRHSLTWFNDSSIGNLQLLKSECLQWLDIASTLGERENGRGLPINYPLISFFKIIRGLSLIPSWFFKIARYVWSPGREGGGGGGGGGVGVNPLFTSWYEIPHSISAYSVTGMQGYWKVKQA